MRKAYFYTFLLSLAFIHSKGQDIHFSQFNWSYLNLNPAKTGDFSGDYRFNGNFKNQWGAISEPYQTFSFSAEANHLIKALPNLNLGIIAYTDEAGLGGLRTTMAALSVSHDFGLNADSSLRLIGGAQLGIHNRRLNFDAFSFDQQYNGNQFNPNAATGENFDQNAYTNFTANIGLMLAYRRAAREHYEIGFSTYNLNSANQSFLDETVPLDRRHNIHAKADFYLSPVMDLIPSLLYSRQGSYTEVLMGSNLRYRLSQSEVLKRNLYGGIWYRNQDALILGVGMDYNQWLFGMSYDINLSDLDRASNNRGGLELSVTYLFKEFKPQLRKFKRCPKFL